MSVPPNGTAQTDAPNADSQNPNQASDAASRSASSAVFPRDEKRDSEPVVDWIREAFRPGNREERPNDQDTAKSGSEEPKEQAGKDNGTEDKGTEPGQPFKVFNSQNEFDRAIQAETDRREARRRQDEDRKREKELRDKDPYAYAQALREREEQEEANKGVTQKAVDFATEQVSHFDRNVLDPLVEAVKDDAAKNAILSSAPAGMEGRGHIARGMIDLITKQAIADARQRLEKDESFIKQILVTYGGQRPEPDVVPAVGAAPRRAVNQDEQFNDFFRSRGRSSLE